MKKKINWLIIGLLVLCCISEGLYFYYKYGYKDPYGVNWCKKSGENYELTYVEGNYFKQPVARCAYGHGGGGANDIAVKEKGEWKVIASGLQNSPSKEIIDKYNLPASITGGE